jgi:hypothetical protein
MAPVYEAPKKTPAWLYVVGACCGCMVLYALFSLVMGVGGFYVLRRTGMQGNLEQAQCLSNLTQISAALEMYASDNDGHLPPAESWCDALLGPSVYLKDPDALKCPGSGAAHGYAMNDEYSGAKLADIKDAANAPLIYESVARIPNAHDRFASLPHPPRHSQGNSILYADRHVQSER